MTLQEAVDILQLQLWDTLFVLETYGSDHLMYKSCGLCHHNFPVSSHFFEHSDYVLCPKCGKPT